MATKKKSVSKLQKPVTKTVMPVQKPMKSMAVMPGKKPKKWIVALLLSIFFGALGIDRFYMGYVGTGILKLLVAIVTIGMAGWIWWLVDLILIATKHDFAKVQWID